MRIARADCSTPSFRALTPFATGASPKSIIIGDFNADGKQDIATANRDGDGKTDFAVYRPSSGTWHIRRSSDNSFYSVNFGVAGDQPAPGDYDGDGTTDTAVFQPSDGVWYILNSRDGTFRAQAWGISSDIPVQ